MKITRDQTLFEKIIMVNGFPGCGKTMLSPIISSFDNVEIMQYDSTIEQTCQYSYLGKISDDVATSSIRMHCDELLYNVSMGRNINCRPSDLSSIFKHRPLLHIKRMLSKGDKAILDIIKKNKPILNITTHFLYPMSEMIFESLDDKLIFIEVVRHPIYMVIQSQKNFSTFETARHGHVRYQLNQKEYTWFTKGWENIFDKCNTFEKTIYLLKWYFTFLFEKIDQRINVIPFEHFVKQPDQYLNKLSHDLDSPINKTVKKTLKLQKVPRQLISDGPSLEIYKRCGWEPPKYFSEELELKARREVISREVSEKFIGILDDLSKAYEERFMHILYDKS
tara:strand:+ start:1067 stop:2074 length:1008 start_codon:yes stop_codon:yes gene_type:complete